MRVEQDQVQQYEHQVFAIPHWAAGARGAYLDWGMRLAGLAGMLSLGLWFSGLLQLTNVWLALFVVMAGWLLFYSSWTVRCYRFGWPKVWVSTGMAESNKGRGRVLDPATGQPVEDEDWLPGIFTPGRRLVGTDIS